MIPENADMWFKNSWIIIFVTALVLSYDCSMAQSRSSASSIILDTDIGPDYDDVGAIAVLYALQDSNEVKILATIGSNRYLGIAGVLDVLNTYYGHPNMPVGLPPREDAVIQKDSQGWSNVILKKYPHDISSNDEARSATALYREVLSNQPDHSVTIISIGFFTNLANLLESGADSYSDLNGRQLVSKKVKQLVSMGGSFDSTTVKREFNIKKDKSSAKIVTESWPTEIIFCGFEIGRRIKTGIPLIRNTKLHSNPVKDVYRISIPQNPGDKNGRSSWDPITVLTAIKGPSPYLKKIPGHILLHWDGSNEWDYSVTGQYFFKEGQSFNKLQTVINRLMQHEPKSLK